MPGNWASFLRVNENKTELFTFLSGVVYDSFQLADKELLITKDDDVLKNPLQLDTSALAPCNDEEADTRIMPMLLAMATKKFSSAPLTLMSLSWQ